jgi:hypothetical protein
LASYILDTTPPPAPGVVVAHATSNDRTPTLTLTAEPGAQLTCTVQRFFQPVSSGVCPTGGTLDLSGQADGEFEITVTATDAAGNVGPPTTVVYVLDTLAPSAPVLVSPASPSPVEHPLWLWTGEDGAVATCTVTAANGQVVQGPTICTSPFTGNFAALPDGAYTISVVLTDAAGNVSKAASSVFVLDRTAPVPPTVVPPHTPDNTTAPHWVISGPRGATLTCTLLRGTTVIAGPEACPANGVFSLDGLPDGTYTLRVTATSLAGNVSAASVTTYVLDRSPPAAPSLAYSAGSTSASRAPYWGFTLPAGTTGRCELWRGSTLIASRSSCRGAVSFPINGSLGTYTLRVYAVDGAGNTSKAMVVNYVLVAAATSGGDTGFGGGGGSSGPATHPSAGGPPAPASPANATITKQVQQILDHLGGASAQARAAARKVAKVVVSGLGVAGLPQVHDRLTNDVSHAVQNVVNAVSKAGGGTGFPLLLLVFVLAFLIAQSRIDRRDPKLALASVAADDNLQFRPPPSRGSFA